MKSDEWHRIDAPKIERADNSHNSEMPPGGCYVVVGPKSPSEYREAAAMLARQFSRELGHKLPYREYDDDDGGKSRVILFVSTEFRDLIIIGAVGVRWVEWDNAPHGWAITWAWIHPYHRRTGILRKAWPLLLAQFPNAHLIHPISREMQSFLYAMSPPEYEI